MALSKEINSLQARKITGKAAEKKFKYSKQKSVIRSKLILNHYKYTFQVAAISQIDFVPTISLLLGLPIPFSNLGMVIPELFSHCPWWDTDTHEVRRVYHRVKVKLIFFFF